MPGKKTVVKGKQPTTVRGRNKLIKRRADKKLEEGNRVEPHADSVLKKVRRAIVKFIRRKIRPPAERIAA